MYPEAQER